jgi:hypothetical protein
MLCRYVKALCPSQHFDEYTPDAWHDVLGRFTLDDCKRAAAGVAEEQPYVAPSDIKRVVQLVRDERIRSVALPEPPSELGDDEVAYRRWLGQQRRRIADGESAADADLPRRDVKGLIEQTRPFQEMP